MIRVDLDNEMQIKAAEKGLTRAIRYIPQWEGVTVKRNFQHDRERLNFPAFVIGSLCSYGLSHENECVGNPQRHN